MLVVMVSGDRGLAGAYNMNILRQPLHQFLMPIPVPVSYVAVGRKGRDLLIRRRKDVIADFSHLPNPPSFADVSAIGQLVVEDFDMAPYDQVWICIHRICQYGDPAAGDSQAAAAGCDIVAKTQSEPYNVTHHAVTAVFIYEPDQEELLNEIVPRFTALQIYQSILSAQASEHAARMVAMRNATENANDLIGALQLEYNKLASR